MRVELWQLVRRYAELRIETPSRRSRLMASLARDGQQMPVVVVPADEAGQYVLIDGYVRRQWRPCCDPPGGGIVIQKTG